jgi:hypothetical protein
MESDEANFTTTSGDKYSKFGVYVKDAYIKWNFSFYNELYIGVQPTPAFEVSEGVWGSRYLEKTILDLRGIVASRDLAVSLRGKFDSTGIVKYWVMYGNNSPGKPESDKYKRMYGNIEINPVKGLSFTAYADYQTKAELKNSYDGKMVNNDALTAAFFVGYKVKDKYSFGVESIYYKVNNGYDDKVSLVNKSGMGLSVFGSLNFGPKLACIARYDYFEPNSKAVEDKPNWILAGLTYKPADKMIISPNVIVETYEKVGSVDITSSVTPRITFCWTF